MLLLFVVMFVVVMLELIVVTFWCVESAWLCVYVYWPNGDGDGDGVFVVDYVVIDVVIVAICVGCDGVSHGEML